MSEETLEQVVKKALAHASKSCTIAFQGGEPTLRGLDFYKTLIELQKKYNVLDIEIQNSIQTNALELDDEFIIFLAENSFLTGISLDGNKTAHNAYRKTASGADTFFDVLDTIGRFDKYRAEYNILTVVNAMTGKKADKIYYFYKKNGMEFLQFIPCLDPLNEAPGGSGHSLTPEVYGKFLCELFDLWYDDFWDMTNPYIRRFENYIAILLGHGAESCDMRGVCGDQYVVEADGEVYPCDFYVLPEYGLGNLNDKTFDEIDEKRKDIGFVEYSQKIRESCVSCRYYPICRGGCRRHRLISDGDKTLNYFCDAYKKFFGHALDRLIEIAETAKGERR